MSTIFDETTKPPHNKASEEEAQIWFEHQQQCHGERQQAFAWQLSPEVDNGRLVYALTQALRQLAGAARLYRYDDDAGVIYYSATELPVVAICYEQQVQERLLQEKSIPLDLAHTTPLQFRLFVGEKQSILGMIIHDILLASLPLTTLLARISALYRGEAAPEPREVRQYGPFSPLAVDRLLLHCGALAQPACGGESSGVHLRAALSTPEGADALATLSQWSARLAATLSAMTQQAPVTLYFTGAGWPLARYAPFTLAAGTVAVTELATQILHYLQSGETSVTVPDSGVPLLIQWQRDPPGVWQLADDTCQPLLMPPAYTAWPLQVIFVAEGQLEIIAGAQLAGWVGEYLLYQSRLLLPSDAAIPTAAPAIAAAHPSLQQLILEAFREGLSRPDLGENDDFFDCGGHSLIATRIIGRLKSEHQIEININDLFSYPTAAQLAPWARTAAVQPVVSGAQDADKTAHVTTLQAPLSLAQKSLWKIYQALNFCEAFNIPFALRFLDPVDEALFHQAMNDILLRHSALRTLFVAIKGEIYQQVIPPEKLAQYEWFWFSDEKQTAPLHTALKQAADHHFALDSELPIRVTFLRDESNGQQVVSLLFHHIVLDEWSVNILMDELAQALASRSAGVAPVWAHSPAPFHAFARQQSETGMNEQHLGFWLEQLQGAKPAAPLFATPTKQQDASDVDGGWVEFKVERQISQGLYQLAKQQGASLFNVVYSGIAAALHLLGGMDELVIGTSASGRNDPRFFDTVGYFTTVVVHRIIFAAIPTLNALIHEVKRQINDSMPYTDIPVDLVEEALFGDSLARDRHMFEVFIQIHAKNKLNGAFPLADGREVRFRQVDPEKTESMLGLQFEVMEEPLPGGADVRVMMSYRTDHYSPAQVEQIINTTQQMFALMAASAGGQDVAINSLCID